MAGKNSKQIVVRKTAKTTPPKQNKIVRSPSFIPSLRAPVAFGAVSGKKPNSALMGVMSGGSCTIKNYEEVGSFSNTGTGGNGPTFNTQTLTCNPGIAAAFPWLSTIAQNYQKFRFLFLRYFYSGAVSTATAGRIFLNLTYDPSDVAPVSTAQVMQSEDSSIGPVWFGGAVNGEKAFGDQINPDSNIAVQFDPTKAPSPWYYVRDTTTGGTNPSTGGSLTGAPTGGIGTLAFVQGTYNDSSAIPARLVYGCDGVTGATPGLLFVSYIVQFAEPVAPAVTA